MCYLDDTGNSFLFFISIISDDFLFYFYLGIMLFIIAFQAQWVDWLNYTMSNHTLSHLFMLLKWHNAAVIILPEWRPGQIIFESTQNQMGNFKEQL